MRLRIYNVVQIVLCFGLSYSLQANTLNHKPLTISIGEKGLLKVVLNEESFCKNDLDFLKAYKKEFVRSIKKEYPLSYDGEISIDNQHGKVDILTWEKNRVKIDIKITVYATTQSEASSVFNKIKFNFDNTTTSVSAQTNIIQNTTWWSNWFWPGTKDKFSIDYEVYLPKTTNLKLRNRHGNVTLAALKGPVDLNLEHCNLEVQEIEEDFSLKLAYGNSTVMGTNDATLNIKCGKLKLNKARDVELLSSYSKIEIEKAADINSNSFYDSYLIGEVHEFRNQGKYDNIAITYAEKVKTTSVYTEINIEKVGSSVDFDLKHSQANILMVSKEFSALILKGSYADYKIAVEDGANYTLNASSNNAGIRFPKKMKVLYENDKNNIYAIQGYVGKQGHSKAIIKAKVTNGGLKVN